MPEAVIVSAARSPIGRAFKGSLKDLRPDDLAATIIQAALAKVPELDPRDIDDLMLGCGLPGGEQGNNLGRIVAVQMGMDHLPGCTVTRYCSSSLQTSRMALHAIKAGEGDVFISAGVEMVSRFTKATADSLPDTHNPLFAEAEARTAEVAQQEGTTWHDPREDGLVPDPYIAMGQTAENLARAKGGGAAPQPALRGEPAAGRRSSPRATARARRERTRPSGTAANGRALRHGDLADRPTSPPRRRRARPPRAMGPSGSGQRPGAVPRRAHRRDIASEITTSPPGKAIVPRTS
ncbi:3-ketoacyl-CoA thiolase [Streptomyces tendae]